jgi:hypothetical protein
MTRRPDNAHLPRHRQSMTYSNPFLEAASRVSNTYGNACAEWQQEMARFISNRLKSDADAGLRMLSCHTWNDATEIQQEWAATVLNDYFDEANRLAELSSTMSSNFFQPFVHAMTGTRDGKDGAKGGSANS